MMNISLRKLQENLLKHRMRKQSLPALQTITEDQTALGHNPRHPPGNAEEQEGTLRPDDNHHHLMWANALLDRGAANTAFPHGENQHLDCTCAIEPSFSSL
jgi:hypothetical protein